MSSVEHFSPAVLPDLSMGWTQRAASALAGWFARVGFAIEVRGLHHVPDGEPCLLCANHTSHLDTFALAAASGSLRPRLVFLAARDYFFLHRGRSWLIRRLICLVPFERGAGLAAAKHNLRMLAASRDAGRIVVLFPEGTRSPDGRMRDFKPGVAMFAEKLGLRVVPCHIAGAHAALPKGRTFPRLGPLRLTFGPGLVLAPAAEAERGTERSARYARFAAELQRAVASLGVTDAPATEPAVLDSGRRMIRGNLS